jgi:ERCC4-related helicase
MLDRVSIQQVADLPEFKMSTRMIAVEDTKALDLAYVELLHAYAEETEHAMVRRLRQRQIIEHEKTQGLFELATEFIESGQKVLHFVNFRDTIENLTILHAKAKHQFGRIDGEVDGGPKLNISLAVLTAKSMEVNGKNPLNCSKLECSMDLS